MLSSVRPWGLLKVKGFSYRSQGSHDTKSSSVAILKAAAFKNLAELYLELPK
jgi:hypothetical protein